MKLLNFRKPFVIATAVLFHSLLVFHLLFSPVIIVMASYKGILNASFFSFIFIFVLSLFFGRAYCAWFCPGCGLQELAGSFVKKKAPYNKAVFLKYIIFLIWFSAIVVGYILKGFTKVDLTFGMSNVPIERKLILTFGAGLIIIPIAIIIGKFASCKYICWQAPFMILGRNIRDWLGLYGLRLITKQESCKKCNSCTKQCPMDINVMSKVTNGEIVDNECILCGNCIKACKFDVISYCISKPIHNKI